MAALVADSVTITMFASDSEKVISTVDATIRAARSCFTHVLPEEWRQVVETRSKLIGAAAQESRLNVVLFHQTVAHDEKKINTIDIKGLDHSRYDYESLIRTNVAIALWSNPGSRIILFTDATFIPSGIDDPRVSIVRLPLVKGEPMFERVVTMLAYVESAAFNASSLFLDSDAFLIRNCAGLFLNPFDIAVTYRDIAGQMPINEGVIMANCSDRAAVKNFFRSYLATYLALERHPQIINTYGSVRRWRGGQLSLNAVSGGWVRYAGAVVDSSMGTKIAYLPCSRYNYSPMTEKEIGPAVMTRALVLHLKGDRKSFLTRMIRILESKGLTYCPR